MNKKARNTLILFCSLLLLSLASFLPRYFFLKATEEICAVITLEGKEYGVYPLSEDIEFDIVNSAGEVNHFAVRDGFAGIDHATCKNQICVHQGFLKNPGEVITCLPNGVVVTFEPRRHRIR